MTSLATRKQVEALFEYLDDHPNGVSVPQIEAHLSTLFTHVNHVPGLVYLARNQFGDGVIVTAYDYGRGVYIYRFAKSVHEGGTYVERRVMMIRSIITNVIGLIDRLLAKFPAEDGTRMIEARTRLQDAHRILDNSRP